MNEKLRHAWTRLTRFAHAHLVGRLARERGANVAIIFALSLIPITVAAGAGLDLARGMVVRSNMSEAVDAAALAVGGTTGLSTTQQQALAQQYFNANYVPDTAYGTPASVTVSATSQSVTVSVTDQLPTTLLSAAGIRTVPVTASSTVVWGQSRLWVALVLDNTGSMSEGDSGGTKLDALKSASQSLLTILQNASATAGDVQVSIVPFAKDVNVGTADVGASWIDWTDWESPPANSTPSSSVGPGSSCPWSTRSNGFQCVKSPTSTSTTSTIPSSGTYSGYICPSEDNGSINSGQTSHYYNGCYNSVYTTSSTSNTTSNTNQVCSKTGSNSASQCTCSGYPTVNSSTSGSTTTVTTTTCGCSSSGSGSRKTTTCTATATAVATTTTSGYNHTWIINNHNTWGGCIMDRTQDYDTTNTSPTNTATDFPAENSDNCPPATVTPLGYNWTTFSSQINAMTANGNTNQTVGLDHGWMTLTSTYPYSAPALPANTSQYIILLSDGLNTQNRWSTTQSSIDAREALACTNAKAAGITIYTIFLDLGGTSGNSTALLNCASDSSKYYDLTTTGSVASTFSLIAQQITNLRVSK